MKQLVKFDDLYIGMIVQDEEGNVGIIKNCHDIHNIFVEYNNGGTGLHCLIEGCTENTIINGEDHGIPHYDPLYIKNN